MLVHMMKFSVIYVEFMEGFSSVRGTAVTFVLLTLKEQEKKGVW